MAQVQLKATLGYRVRFRLRTQEKKRRAVGEKARKFLECRMQPSPSNIVNIVLFWFVFARVYVWPVTTV